MIIDASPMSVKVINICIISVERTIFYSGQDGIDILLQFIHVSLLRRLFINQCASAITDIVGGIVRKLKGIGVDLQIFRENVKGQDGIGILAFLRNGNDRLLEDGIGVNVCKNDLTICFYCHLVPNSVFIVKSGVAFPGIGGNQFPIEDCIGVYRAGTNDGLYLLIIGSNPGLYFFIRITGFFLFVDRMGPKRHQRFIYRQVVRLFRNIAFCQCCTQFLKIAQERVL